MIIPGDSYVDEKEFGAIALAFIVEKGMDKTNAVKIANVKILNLFIYFIILESQLK
jgi:hypothetical protein